MGALSADEFMAALDHPLKADIEAVRAAILSTDETIADGVKWNSLSFRTTEWFATVNLRARDQVQLVLHLGAKPGKIAPTDAIPDPLGLLDWKGKDRALATLGAGKALKANLPAFKSLVRAWSRLSKPEGPFPQAAPENPTSRPSRVACAAGARFGNCIALCTNRGISAPGIP